MNSNVVVNGYYNNNGITYVASGRFLRATSGIDNYAGAQLNGPGRIIGTVYNGGTMHIGGSTYTKEIEGSFFNADDGSAGIMVFNIEGRSPCPESSPA